jgi:hypothetical protein
MTNQELDGLLRHALYAGAAATDEVSEGASEYMRRFADELYGKPHVLLTPETCNVTHSEDRQCPVCDGGLAVCMNCGEFEAGLDNPCRGKVDLTAIHDTATCTAGEGGEACEACAWASNVERQPFPRTSRLRFE